MSEAYLGQYVEVNPVSPLDKNLVQWREATREFEQKEEEQRKQMKQGAWVGIRGSYDYGQIVRVHHGVATIKKGDNGQEVSVELWRLYLGEEKDLQAFWKSGQPKSKPQPAIGKDPFSNRPTFRSGINTIVTRLGDPDDGWIIPD